MRSTVSYTEDGMGGYTGFVLSRGLFLYKGTFLLLGNGDGVLDDLRLFSFCWTIFFGPFFDTMAVI